jgi:uncharacterized protein YabN with tetrapyrrole methylase and pyrophosphatase domain
MNIHFGYLLIHFNHGNLFHMVRDNPKPITGDEKMSKREAYKVLDLIVKEIIDPAQSKDIIDALMVAGIVTKKTVEDLLEQVKED